MINHELQRPICGLLRISSSKYDITLQEFIIKVCQFERAPLILKIGVYWNSNVKAAKVPNKSSTDQYKSQLWVGWRANLDKQLSNAGLSRSIVYQLHQEGQSFFGTENNATENNATVVAALTRGRLAEGKQSSKKSKRRLKICFTSIKDVCHE